MLINFDSYLYCVVRYKLCAWVLSCATAFVGGWYVSAGRLSNLESVVGDMRGKSDELISLARKAPTLDLYCTQNTNSLVDRECNITIEIGDREYGYKFNPYRAGTGKEVNLRPFGGYTTRPENGSVVTLLD